MFISSRFWFLFLIHFYLFICLAVLGLNCIMWDLWLQLWHVRSSYKVRGHPHTPCTRSVKS